MAERNLIYKFLQNNFCRVGGGGLLIKKLCFDLMALAASYRGI